MTDSDEEIKQAVEMGKNIIRGINQGHHDLTDIDKFNIQILINLAHSYLSVTGLPEKKYYDDSKLSGQIEYNKGFNDALDACRLAFAKKLDGLEEVLEKSCVRTEDYKDYGIRFLTNDNQKFTHIHGQIVLMSLVLFVVKT
jgi:hypothetical protein